MKRKNHSKLPYYRTVEDAMQKLREASNVLKDTSLKISRFKEQTPQVVRGHGKEGQ